jgi:D-alanine transaminase/branched-chain amino acid aminotransferase
MEVFLNNTFLPAAKAQLPVTDLAIQRGYGIFDFFRVQEGVLLYAEDHIERFMRSAEVMHLPVRQSKQEMLEILTELNRRNGLRSAGVRMVLTGGDSPDAWQIGEPALLVIQQHMTIDPAPVIPKAVSVITHDYLRDIPQAKTINYTMGVWLQKRMRELNADDVLYHHHGKVAEFPRCNVFIVTGDGLVVTPHREVLFGVTRKRLLEIDGVYEGPVTLNDVKTAREIFLTSSTKRIHSVVSVDGKPVGDGKPGPVSTELLRLLIEKERDYIAAHS